MVVEEEVQSVANRFMNAFADSTISEMGALAGKIGGEMKYGLSKMVDGVEGNKFSVPLLRQLEKASTSLIRLGDSLIEHEKLYMTEDVEKAKEDKIKAVLDVAKSVSVLSGSGVHHIFEYLTTLYRWKNPDEKTYKRK